MNELKLNSITKEVGENNKKHGFRDENLKCTDFVTLIHSEVSEILEEFRKGRRQMKYIIEKMENQRECPKNWQMW